MNSLFYTFGILIFGIRCCDGSKCGLKKDVNPFMRIIGGDVAGQNSWPWQALFITLNDDGIGLMCGATLITNQWLLTAAHCAQYRDWNTFVALGTTSLNDLEDIERIDTQIIHPNFDPITASDDIALIRMTDRVNFRPEVTPICVPQNDKSLIRAGTTVYATGFGLTIDGLPNNERTLMKSSDSLMQTSLPIIDQKSCTSQWRMLSGGQIAISDKQICAGSYLKGTAPGDSGGPLQVEGSNGEWYIVGITSFGANGNKALIDQKTYPGVYTRVTAYFDWILDTIETYESLIRARPNSTPVVTKHIYYLILFALVFLIF